MIKKKDNLIPRLWTLVSMIALITFLVYWNYCNYHSEREQLQQNLSNQLQLAYTEVMDSVFVEEVVVLAQFNKFDYFDANENTLANDSITIITYSDNLNTKTEEKVESNHLVNEANELSEPFKNNGTVLQSDRINKVIEDLFTAKSDHKPEIENRFISKIEALGYPSEYRETNSIGVSSLPIYYVGERKFDTPVSIQIVNYHSYIWKSILSPLAFSLLLLGIVGLAFWTLLVNWAKQQKLIEIKNEFISNMTHELKTPISTVGLALEAISGFDLSKDESKTKEYVEISRHELNRLSLLVDKVLKMASYEGTTEHMNRDSIVLSTTTESIIKSMKLYLEENGAKVNYSNKSNRSEIIGDKVHITNVIYNIVDNAVKYSDHAPIIDIIISESDTDIILKISDQGKGISQEYLDKIFDRFFRVPITDRHNVKGHGLGLSYVQDVINKHGGTIKVESKLNLGTTFIVQLPKPKNDV